MLFYSLLIIFTILFILYEIFKTLGNKKKAEQYLQDSFDNLKETWNDFKRQFR